jgi:hypothetical protein
LQHDDALLYGLYGLVHRQRPEMRREESTPPFIKSAKNRMTVMVGGAKFQGEVTEWFSQSKNLFTVIFYAIIIVWAGFADKIPAVWRWQLSTTIGRLLLLLLLWCVYLVGGFIPALLFTLAICMTWANRPLFKPSGQGLEGFNDSVKTTKVPKNRWFVEKALLETPKEIVEDRVDTDAVSENFKVGNARTSR